jgi:hypothetical protein
MLYAMADDFDLDAVFARLPQPSLADIQQARHEAEQGPPPPPSTIPQPEFLPGCIARFHCPLACGWHHDESTDPGPMGPLLLPADFTSVNLSAALTSEAEIRGNGLRLRIEQAIAEHFTEAHPGR